MKLRHETSGESVKIALGQYEGWVTAAEAKRFAWAILADLDPEEAAACGMPKPRPGRASYGTVSWALMTALSSGPKPSRELAPLAGLSDVSAVAARIHFLIRRGLVGRTQGPGPGNRAIYALTEAGKEAMGGGENG